MLKQLEMSYKQHCKVENVSHTTGVAICINIKDLCHTNSTLVSVTFMKNNKKTFRALPSDSFNRIMNWVETWLKQLARPSSISDLHYTSLSQIYTNRDFQKWNCHRLFFIPQETGKDVVNQFIEHDVKSLLCFPEIQQVALVTDVAGVASVKRFFEE